MRRSISLVTDRFPGRPGFDAAVSRAVLQGVASGDLSETLRLTVAERLVAFGSRDLANPEFPAARRAAASAGFGSYLRLAGGKAAAFHEGTIAFGWAVPSADPRVTIEERFAEIGGILVDALAGLGIDARVGEVPGEYCPGEHSINAGGTHKLIGIGQRLIGGAAHVGGVIVAERADLVNRALEPVYEALGYDWEPATTGAAADHAPVTVGDLLAAVEAAFGDRHDLVPGSIDAPTLGEAARLEAAGRGALRARSR